MDKILVILVLFAVIAVAIGSCSAMSQETFRYTVDRTLETVDRQPSASELLMQSRQTAPVQAESNSMLWIGVAVALIAVILIGAGLAYFIFGERWLKERRKYINAQKRRNGRQSRPPVILPAPPTAELPPVGSVPRVRRLRDSLDEVDYGY